MKSDTHVSGGVECCPTRETLRHARSLILAIALSASVLLAQPASITTIPQPPGVVGPEIFDAAGNMYAFQGGPVTPGAAQTTNGGGTCVASNGFFDYETPCSDAYVGKIDAHGNLVFGTYLGGPTADLATAIAVDSSGNVYITGTTGGSFPTSANAAVANSTTATAFAAKISADGSRVLYSTYLPNTAATPEALAVDAQGNAYVAGKSTSGHAFVVKVSADGSAFLYDVSLGGKNQDSADALVMDASGNLIVAGHTGSPDFPVSTGALQSTLKGAQNTFVAKLNPGGSVVFSTFLGGSGSETPAAVQTDGAGNIYVVGQTSSFDFPTTAGSFEPSPFVPMWNNAAPAGFAVRLSADGGTLAWSSYVMSMDGPLQNGVTQRGVAGLAVTASGDTYISGLTGAGFPVTPSAPQVCFDGPWADIFVAHMDAHGALLDATYNGSINGPLEGISVAADGSALLAWTNTSGNVRSQLRFGGAGWSAPACLSPAILNSTTLSSHQYSLTGPSVVPGEFITLTGFGIGPDMGVAYQPDAQGQIPKQLAGVQVLFDGEPAPIVYAQSRQINVLAPVELSGKSATNITLVYNQATVGSANPSVAAFGSPGIFRNQPGLSSQAAALNQDGTLNSSSNPAPRGSVVAVWGTGFGLTAPACATGGLNAPGPVNLQAGLSVEIAPAGPPGTAAVSTPALYAGSAPTQPCGIVQINMLVPTALQPGPYSFFPWSLQQLAAGGQAAAQGIISATIYVK